MKAIRVEKRGKILQTMLLCTKPCKNKSEEDKSLRGTDGAGQHAYFLLMCSNSMVMLWPAVFQRTYTGKIAVSMQEGQVLLVQLQVLSMTSCQSPMAW